MLAEKLDWKGLKDKKPHSWEKDTRLAQSVFNPYSANVENMVIS
jgi:hypothetical protein